MVRARGSLSKYDAGMPGATTTGPLTNGEVITLTMALLGAGGAKVKEAWPFWYQFAAAAYGWSPSTDAMKTSTSQRDAWFPDELAAEFWSTARIYAVGELDRLYGSGGARFSLDGTFDDPSFIGEVRSALLDDGASAEFKIPLPACRDPKTGKPSLPKRNPKTGKWECAPLLVDDPVSVVKRKTGDAFTLVLLILGAWVLFDNKPRRRRR